MRHPSSPTFPSHSPAIAQGELVVKLYKGEGQRLHKSDIGKHGANAQGGWVNNRKGALTIGGLEARVDVEDNGNLVVDPRELEKSTSQFLKDHPELTFAFYTYDHSPLRDEEGIEKFRYNRIEPYFSTAKGEIVDHNGNPSPMRWDGQGHCRVVRDPSHPERDPYAIAIRDNPHTLLPLDERELTQNSFLAQVSPRQRYTEAQFEERKQQLSNKPDHPEYARVADISYEDYIARQVVDAKKTAQGRRGPQQLGERQQVGDVFSERVTWSGSAGVGTAEAPPARKKEKKKGNWGRGSIAAGVVAAGGLLGYANHEVQTRFGGWDQLPNAFAPQSPKEISTQDTLLSFLRTRASGMLQGRNIPDERQKELISQFEKSPLHKYVIKELLPILQGKFGERANSSLQENMRLMIVDYLSKTTIKVTDPIVVKELVEHKSFLSQTKCKYVPLEGSITGPIGEFAMYHEFTSKLQHWEQAPDRDRLVEKRGIPETSGVNISEMIPPPPSATRDR